MRQHHATAAYPYTVCRSCDRADQNFGTVAGQTLRSMMFCNPVTPVAEFVRQTCEVDAVPQGLSGCGTLGNGRLIENAEAELRHLFLRCMPGPSDSWIERGLLYAV